METEKTTDVAHDTANIDSGKKEKATKTKADSNPKKYSKTQLLESAVFSDKRDLLHALLDDEQTYSKDDVNKLISEYLRKKV